MPFGASMPSVVWCMGNILKPMGDCSSGMKSLQTHSEYSELPVTIINTNKSKKTGLYKDCSKIFNGYFMCMLCKNMIPAQFVDRSDFKA